MLIKRRFRTLLKSLTFTFHQAILQQPSIIVEISIVAVLKFPRIPVKTFTMSAISVNIDKACNFGKPIYYSNSHFRKLSETFRIVAFQNTLNYSLDKCKLET